MDCHLSFSHFVMDASVTSCFIQSVLYERTESGIRVSALLSFEPPPFILRYHTVMKSTRFYELHAHVIVQLRLSRNTLTYSSQ